MKYERLFASVRDSEKLAQIPADWEYRVERIVPIIYKQFNDQERFLFDNWFKEDKMHWIDIATYLGVNRPKIDTLARSIRLKFNAPILKWMRELPANEVLTEKQTRLLRANKMKLQLLDIKGPEIKTLKTYGIKNIAQLKAVDDDFLLGIKGIATGTVKRYRDAIEYWDSLTDYIVFALSHPYLPEEEHEYSEIEYAGEPSES